VVIYCGMCLGTMRSVDWDEPNMTHERILIILWITETHGKGICGYTGAVFEPVSQVQICIIHGRGYYGESWDRLKLLKEVYDAHNT